MADKQTLGEVIREARGRRGLRLRQLAQLLEVTPSYVSDIENDRRVPSEEVLQRIARELVLDFEDLAARAGRLRTDTERYLRGTPVATTLFRRAAEEKWTEEEIRAAMERIREMRGKNEGEQ